MQNELLNFKGKARNEREQAYYDSLQTTYAQPRRADNSLVGYHGEFDFRLGIDGIREFFKKKRIYIDNGKRKLELDNLEPGEFIALVNRDQTGVKLVGRSNIVVYQKTPKGQKLHPGAIVLIPRYFNGKEIDLTRAQEQAIREDFAKYLSRQSKKVKEIDPELH
jgi:hypothetical protein